VRLETHLDGAPPVRCTPYKVERVLLNLLIKALRHTSSDGAIAVLVEPASKRCASASMTPARNRTRSAPESVRPLLAGRPGALARQFGPRTRDRSRTCRGPGTGGSGPKTARVVATDLFHPPCRLARLNAGDQQPQRSVSGFEMSLTLHAVPGPTEDGAFMEPRGCNRWQSVANGHRRKSAEVSQSRCRGLRPVALGDTWKGGGRRSSPSEGYIKGQQMGFCCLDGLRTSARSVPQPVRRICPQHCKGASRLGLSKGV